MAESFGIDPERYDRTRPTYPSAMVDRIVAASPGPVVLDVGCGTGIEGRQFRDAGCSVLGVEPDARMAEFARQTGLDIEVGTFETWEHDGREFDAVISGTAWHWIDPVAGAARAAQVLRPGGRLAPFWHVSEVPPEITSAFARVYREMVPDSPFDLASKRSALEGYQPLFDRAADGIRRAGSFGEPERWAFEWERTYGRDEWLEQLPTSGAMTRLRPDQAEPVLAAVGAAIDALGGTFTATYTTVVVTAARR
jgi:SAM-dependent methyltransferase